MALDVSMRGRRCSQIFSGLFVIVPVPMPKAMVGEEKIDGNQDKISVLLSVSITALNGGFHVGWASPSLLKLQSEDSDLPVTSDQGAWIASCFYFGGAFGSVIAGPMADKWGRKLAFISTVCPNVISCILIIAAQNYWWLIIARFIAALGYSASSTLISMYLGEISSIRIRGALSVLTAQMASLGILLAYSVGPWVSRVALGGVGLSLPIVFLLFSFWIPESPYFLVMKKRNEDAQKTLAWLRGTSNVEEEMKDIEENVAMEENGNLNDLIRGNRKALVILVVVALAPQLSGVPPILAYASLILAESGFVLSASISVIIIGAVQFLSGGLSIFVTDSFGRRPLLILSLLGSMIFLIAEALYFQLRANGTDVTSISWIPVTAIIGFIMFSSIGLGCLPFAIIGEIFPCNVKAVAMICTLFVSAFSAMAVTKLYQVVADAYGIHVSFWTFAACSLFMLFLIYFILPETKQRSLTDIQKGLRSTKDFTTTKK